MVRRRTLLQWLTVGGVVVVASVLAVPTLLSALTPAARPRRPIWRRIGPLHQFLMGSVVRATVAAPDGPYPKEQLPAVYVWHRAPSDVVVFSRACTDLGCAVKHDPGSGFFYCPCHGGIFNRVGDPVAGPPPRPLHRYATRVRNGVLEIDVASVPSAAA